MIRNFLEHIKKVVCELFKGSFLCLSFNKGWREIRTLVREREKEKEGLLFLVDYMGL